MAGSGSRPHGGCTPRAEEPHRVHRPDPSPRRRAPSRRAGAAPGRDRPSPTQQARADLLAMSPTMIPFGLALGVTVSALRVGDGASSPVGS